MKQPKISTLIYTTLAAFALLVTFIIGVHVGSYQSWLMDSSARARITLYELKAMRKGKFDELIKAKEASLDGDIVQALRFQQTGHPWLFFPFDSNYEREKYLHAIAQYRKEYPSPALSLDSGNGKESLPYQTIVKTQTDLLLKQYGN